MNCNSVNSCKFTVQLMNQKESVHTFWIFCSSLNARVAHIQYLHQCCGFPGRSWSERASQVSMYLLSVWHNSSNRSGLQGLWVKICHTLTVARKTEFKLRPVGWNHISNPVKWIVILSITAQSLACGETHKSRPFLCLQSRKKRRVLNICLDRSASLDLSFYWLRRSMVWNGPTNATFISNVMFWWKAILN